jgi:hypothetical protein
MRIASSRKKYKILLLFCLSLSIINNNNLAFAQKEEEQRDPFLSLADKIKLGDTSSNILPFPVVLSGIIWTKDMPVAMVNNEIVQQGEDWQGLKVEKIEKDKLILKRGQTLFEIPLVTEKKDDEDKQKD